MFLNSTSRHPFNHDLKPFNGIPAACRLKVFRNHTFFIHSYGFQFEFNEPIPELQSDPSDILKLHHKYGSPAAVAQTAGKYFGFVNGSAIPVSIAAKWLSDVWDQNTALYVISPIASKLEEICEKWLTGLLGLPSETAAGFVSGTSIATFCGLAAGRNELLRKSGWDVNERGLFGAPNLRVIIGEQAHGTVFKALALLGLGKERVEKVTLKFLGVRVWGNLWTACVNLLYSFPEN